MTDTDPESEVPPELERRIEALDAEQRSPSGDVAAPADAVAGDLPEVCPVCGGRLTPNSVFTDANGDAVAVRLTCRSTHEGGRIATYVYAVDGDELYLEDESEPGDDHRRWVDDEGE